MFCRADVGMQSSFWLRLICVYIVTKELQSNVSHTSHYEVEPRKMSNHAIRLYGTIIFAFSQERK